MIESSVIIETINRWNEDSLRLIYTHHYKLLMAYAIQLLGERTEAEDAVQDVLLNTWEQRNAYETERHLRTYLFNAVRNRCLTILNHLNVTVSHQERLRREYREMALEDHSIALHKEEVYRQLFLAIDQMPSKQRKPLTRQVGNTCSSKARRKGGKVGRETEPRFKKPTYTTPDPVR